MAGIEARVHDLESTVGELKCNEAAHSEVIKRNLEVLEEVKTWINTTGNSITTCQKEQAVYCNKVDALAKNQESMSARLWAVSLTIITIVLGAIFADKALGAGLSTKPQETQIMFGIDFDVIKDILAILALVLPWVCLKVPQLAWFENKVLKLLGGNPAIFKIINAAETLDDLDSDDARMNYVAQQIQTIYNEKTGLKLSDTSARLVVQWVYKAWKKKFG